VATILETATDAPFAPVCLEAALACSDAMLRGEAGKVQHAALALGKAILLLLTPMRIYNPLLVKITPATKHQQDASNPKQG